MLIRKTYYDHKKDQIQHLVLEIVERLTQMMEQADEFLLQPTKDKKNMILQTENYIDDHEKKIEKYILEIISLEQLNTSEIRWLFSMSRIIRELERVGDQLTNVLSISGVVDTSEIRPKIRDFFNYEQAMLEWLTAGIQDNDTEKLEAVVSHDAYVNNLNKETYQDTVELIQEEEQLTESKLKMVVISRFLERIGDHLANAAKAYKRAISDMEEQT